MNDWRTLGELPRTLANWRTVRQKFFQFDLFQIFGERSANDRSPRTIVRRERLGLGVGLGLGLWLGLTMTITLTQTLTLTLTLALTYPNHNPDSNPTPAGM